MVVDYACPILCEGWAIEIVPIESLCLKRLDLFKAKDE
jgi:hypothetical protein